VWIFTRDSFLSIVRDRTDPERMLVRAREAEDIRRIWPSADVTETPDADYRFRASIGRTDTANTIAALVSGITYTTDFKGGVREKDRHDAYFKVWDVMHRWQQHRSALGSPGRTNPSRTKPPR